MKLILSKKQKIIGFSLLILILLIIFGFLFFYNKQRAVLSDSTNSSVLKPVFLNKAEKTALNIKPETKIQVIKRNSEGKIILYKVIKNDSDIVSNLNQLTPTPQPKK